MGDAYCLDAYNELAGLGRIVDRPAGRYFAGVCNSETDVLDDADQVIAVEICER